jgi:hypothetical protein
MTERTDKRRTNDGQTTDKRRTNDGVSASCKPRWTCCPGSSPTSTPSVDDEFTGEFTHSRRFFHSRQRAANPAGRAVPLPRLLPRLRLGRLLPHHTRARPPRRHPQRRGACMRAHTPPASQYAPASPYAVPYRAPPSTTTRCARARAHAHTPPASSYAGLSRAPPSITPRCVCAVSLSTSNSPPPPLSSLSLPPPPSLCISFSWSSPCPPPPLSLTRHGPYAGSHQ